MLRLLLLMMIALPTFAVDPYTFSSEENRQQFQTLSGQLRCPKCINQNLIGSDAEIAGDLRRELYQQVEADKSSDEIINFMVARYGNFINYDPPFNQQTWYLWFIPISMLVIGILAILWLSRRRSGNNEPLTSREQQKLDDILREDT